jgi:beta-galactosidase
MKTQTSLCAFLSLVPPGGGALPGAIGWYRNACSLPAMTKGESVSFDFDGLYRNSEVWINGAK